MSDQGDSAATRDLLTRYYEGLSKKSDWGSLLADDFLLTGTVAKDSRGRDLYVANGFFRMVRGVKVRELMVEGRTGFAIVNYALVSPRGRSFSCDVAEFWRVAGGRLASVAIYFDTAAFNSFLA